MSASELTYASNEPAPSRRSSRQQRGIVPWLALTGFSMLWLAPLAVFSGCLFFIPVLGWFASPLLTLLAVFTLHRIISESRKRNGRAIVSYLDMAVRLNLPIVPMIGAAARSERGRCARQLMTLQHDLETGKPISAALSDADDVSDKVAARIEAAEPLGQLRRALSESVEEDRQAMADEAGEPEGTYFRIYPFAVFFVLFFVLSFTMIFVVPKFKEIFKDFKTELPALTQAVMKVLDWVAFDYGWMLLMVLPAAVLIVAAAACTRIFLPFVPLPNFRRILQRIAWWTPVLHGAQRDAAMAETCALLAPAMAGGVPLPDALAHASRLEADVSFRRQLLQFRESMQKGVVPAEAARAAGLPDLMVGLLAPAGLRAPDAQVFTFLERYYRLRFSRTLQFLRGALEPAMILSIAALVATIVVALFLPLVKLIQSVSGPAGGAL